MPAHLAHPAGESQGRAELSTDHLQRAGGRLGVSLGFKGSPKPSEMLILLYGQEVYPALLPEAPLHWLGGAGYLK